MKMVRKQILMEKLGETTFYKDPASTRFHLNTEGGLALHSKHVTENLLTLTEKLGLVWQDIDSPIIIGYGHDLCKMGSYVRKKGGVYVKNPRHPDGHGELSVKIIKGWFELTEEEEACIRWHMGAFDDRSNWNKYSSSLVAFPNVLWTHTADMMATFMDEVNI